VTYPNRAVVPRTILPSAQVNFRHGMIGLMEAATGQISAALLRAADDDGIVPIEQLGNMQRQGRQILARVFGGQDAVSRSGRPQSPYARILLEQIGLVTYQTVAAHQRFLKETLPPDLFAWLAAARPVREMVTVLAEQESLEERFPSLTADEIRQIRQARIFIQNKLVEYEQAHTWVDPNGYRLSERIWNTEQSTRLKLDLLLADMITNGHSARDIAKLVEQFLIPGRELIRTNRPYGSNGSYDAMRLARTEISRAANQAAYMAAYMNPYVEGIDVARSNNGDRDCPVCPDHATIDFGGVRVKEPYPVNNAGGNIPPFHPHDMCYVLPALIADPDATTQRLRSILDFSREENLTPVMNPAQIDGFTQQLLGQALWDILRQILPAQPPLL
jgi:hypothetical protein